MNAVVPPVGAGLPAIGLELTVQVACPGLIAGKPAPTGTDQALSSASTSARVVTLPK